MAAAAAHPPIPLPADVYEFLAEHPAEGPRDPDQYWRITAHLDDFAGGTGEFYVERTDGRWFVSTNLAPIYRGKKLSRRMAALLCARLGEIGMPLDEPIFIDADASGGFWEQLGFTPILEPNQPDKVSTRGKICGWARHDHSKDPRRSVRRWHQQHPRSRAKDGHSKSTARKTRGGKGKGRKSKGKSRKFKRRRR